ncbi:alpha/beta-hydrolase [Gautieria morchelliformis]|nr:alpha/beta-hydrolase [Gautieria morchelliformis]
MSPETVPGILHVLTDPGPNVTLNEFHDWYNNEHGPMRMRLSAIKSGVRYEATDALSPRWMATYELDDIAFLEQPVYTHLRQHRSRREAGIIARMAILDRAIYRLVTSRRQRDAEPGNVVVTVSLIAPKTSSVDLEQWYIQEHIAMLSLIPGWLRSRLLVDVSSDTLDFVKYIAVHEYTKSNGLEGPAHKAAQCTPWRARVMSFLKQPAIRRTYRLHRVLPKLTNDLSHIPPGAPCVIDSFYSKDDGVKLHYRLEGSPTGPVIAFSNALLTDLHVWDHIIPYLAPNYLVLRYDARGHGLSTAGSTEPSVGELSADLLSLISALNIPRLHAVIGVSLGGVTALHFALHNPTCVARFIGADFDIASNPASNAVWESRVAFARSSGHTELARQTIMDWFLSTSVQAPGAQAVEQMILATSLPGFSGGVHALCNYDLRDMLPFFNVPALFVVGTKDGTLPEAMREFSATVPDARFTAIEDSGHLPMVENPESFWSVIAPFL